MRGPKLACPAALAASESHARAFALHCGSPLCPIHCPFFDLVLGLFFHVLILVYTTECKAYWARLGFTNDVFILHSLR